MIGQLNWPGSTAIEAVLGEIMTRYLDADVETISAAQEALYEGLDKGDGSVDIVADMWTDHLPAQMKDYVLPGGKETIILNTTPYLGTEGIFIPTYIAEENGVTKLVGSGKAGSRQALRLGRQWQGRDCGPAKSVGNRPIIPPFAPRPTGSTRPWN